MQAISHRVIEVRRLGGDAYVLALAGPFEPVEGGQFAMLRTRDAWPVLLPRPFSFFDVEAGRATFFGKAVGPGTRALRDVRPGEEVFVAGPLGGGFPEVDDGSPEPVCIAGGVGLAPFLLWAKQRFAASGAVVPLLYGGANRDALAGMDDFAPGAQRFHVATDDGSEGFHGNVLQLYADLVRRGEIDGRAPVYCCGPDPMMHAVAADCRERGVACHVSLETYMACGYGVCNGCTVRVNSDGRFAGKIHSRTCIDGPVYAADELVW